MMPHASTDDTTRMNAMPANLRVVENEVGNDGLGFRGPSMMKAPVRKPVPVTIPAVPAGGLVRPQAKRVLPRPVAMKVVRPIPQRVSEQFYNEAFNEGLEMKDTNQAVVLAHDWHRKWTQQDEANHTMPDRDFYDSSQLPSHYGFEVERHGAQNPSLFGSSPASPMADENVKRTRPLAVYPAPLSPQLDPVIFNPDDRLSASSWTESTNSSSLSSHMAPQLKRRFVGDVDTDGPPPATARPAPIAVQPVAVRPMAVRVVRPEIPPVHDIGHGGVPTDITAVTRHENFSPISCSEGSASSEDLLITMMNRQMEVNHIIEDDEPENIESGNPEPSRPANVSAAREKVLHALAVTQGDVESGKFKDAVDPLLKYFSQRELDTRPHLEGCDSVEGMWLTLSKPTYFGCLGENDNGDPMYTLGRMSFDMFSPTNLVCSLQGNFNPVEVVDEEQRKVMLEAVPKSLREEVECGKTVLRTYHVVAAFTIEPALASFPNAPNKDVHRPIKGIMTTFGYSLPDPEVPNRHSIWFTGGRIEPNNNASDVYEWKRLFKMHPPKHTFGEKAKLLAVKLLMGATVPEGLSADGSMEYVFTRPLGGHGMAYIDVVYMDDTLRVVKGHRGTFFVFSRLPQK